MFLRWVIWERLSDLQLCRMSNSHSFQGIAPTVDAVHANSFAARHSNFPRGF